MPTNPKVVAAFRAMQVLGIPEDRVKPVLKSLLRLYDNKWELIEEENYWALLDGIRTSDQEEALSRERNKRHENADQVEMDEEMTDSSRPYKKHIGAEAHPSSPQPLTGNKGKKPVSPKPSSDLASPQIHLKGKGKEPLYLQTASGEKKAISGRSSQGVVPLCKQVQNSLALIKPNDEPFTEDMPQFEVPVVHPDLGPVNLSGPRPAAAAKTEAPPPVATPPTPVVTEPSPQPQRKRPRQEECDDPQVEQGTGMDVDPSGGGGGAGGVRVETEEPIDVEAEPTKFVPLFTCGDGLRADPSIAAGLPQGVCLPKDMAALLKDAAVSFEEALNHLVGVVGRQCMVNARGRISKLSDDLARSKDEVKDGRQKLAEERKLREDAEQSAEAVKAELQQAKEVAEKVPALEAEMEKMLKRHKRELARAGQEYIAQSRRMCNETAAKQYPRGYEAGYVQGWNDRMTALQVLAESSLWGTIPQPIAPAPVMPYSAEECASPPSLPDNEEEEEEQADGQ